MQWFRAEVYPPPRLHVQPRVPDSLEAALALIDQLVQDPLTLHEVRVTCSLRVGITMARARQAGFRRRHLETPPPEPAIRARASDAVMHPKAEWTQDSDQKSHGFSGLSLVDAVYSPVADV